jgi:hypothetical protein
MTTLKSVMSVSDQDRRQIISMRIAVLALDFFFGSKLACLVFEHDGDSVSDRIGEAVWLAYKLLLVAMEQERALA